MNREVIHREMNAVPIKVVSSGSEVSNDTEFNELDLMRQKQVQNLKYGLKNMLKVFKSPKEAKRAREYLERQAWHSLHRTIELIRGDKR